ncbi:hypothetical protein SH528x_004538 [Novipirellula sp. SH528]|uniref:hypothetical protein n=1 Tax=Novipirellula sp. SH528 TaxID=3454466 RepID=UPI003FA0BCA4
MKPTYQFSLLTLSIALLWFTGCCGPSCGGGANGPFMLGGGGCGTQGCGECEGCGELYVDPWVNHPADACDPCDKCGNHNGQSCGKCRSVFSGVESLWGYRCGVDAGCDGGCDSGCDSGCEVGCGCESCASESYPSEFHSGGEYISGESHYPGETIVESEEPAYQPERTRKIFRSKPQVARGVPTPAKR